MRHRNVNIGIDYHHGKLQVNVMDEQRKSLVNRACANDVNAVVELVGKQVKVRGVAIEACTGSAHLAEQLIGRTGWKVELAHPGIVSRLKSSPDKSDFSDARLLADLVRTGYVPRVWLPGPEVRELRKLIRYRQKLVDQRRSIKLQVTAILRDNRAIKPDGIGSNWTIGWLLWVEKTELPEQSRWVVGSGARSADAGLIKAANGQLRAILIEGAHRLARSNDKWKKLYERLIAAGKHPCVAKAAVANRWVRWLHHEMVCCPNDSKQPNNNRREDPGE